MKGPQRTARVEGCASDRASVEHAIAAGVDRIELCEHLDVGGITPSEALLGWTLERTTLPIHVMIRQRGGSYVHPEDELRAMERDAKRMIALGAAGIVTGVLTAAQEVDRGAMRRLRDAHDGPLTFHRAFDELPEPLAALEDLIALGVTRLLTSGGQASAWDGRQAIAALVQHGAGRIEVMAGGKVQASHARELLLATGAQQLHVRAERAAAVVQALASAT